MVSFFSMVLDGFFFREFILLLSKPIQVSALAVSLSAASLHFKNLYQDIHIRKEIGKPKHKVRSVPRLLRPNLSFFNC